MISSQSFFHPIEESSVQKCIKTAIAVPWVYKYMYCWAFPKKQMTPLMFTIWLSHTCVSDIWKQLFYTMDPEVARRLLRGLKEKKELMKRTQSFHLLFFKGFGFNQFLIDIFLLLSFEEMLSARLVCSTWKNFIDEYVWFKHRSIVWLLHQFPEIKVHVIFS